MNHETDSGYGIYTTSAIKDTSDHRAWYCNITAFYRPFPVLSLCSASGDCGGYKHYSAQEIQAMVLKGHFGDNSLYLSLKYKNKEIKGIPFIDTMDVIIVSNDTIKVSVYEKALAGYVEYLGRYMYFDNDGMVVEAAKVPTQGIPQVTGLTFDHIVLYEKLPIENDQIFQNILTNYQAPE